MTRVLVVDDDPHLLRTLRINLTAHGWTVVTATTGAGALRAAADHPPPDLVVLDLGLPDLTGMEVLHGLRGWSAVPVVVLTARTGSAETVAALDAGADDYVTKPFSVPVLLARMRAAHRRAVASPADGAAVVVTGHFTVDLAAKKVTRDGVDVHLSPTEWGVLEQLARHRNTLLTRRQLLDEVWGPGYTDDGHYLRVYLAHLRRKLEPEPSRPRYLLTEPGRGYRLETGD